MLNSEELLKQLTLAEKASLCSGENFWFLKELKRVGLGRIMMTDGPHGMRKQRGDGGQLGTQETVNAVSFPTAVNMASSWNPGLVLQVGEALGLHCRHEAVSVLLGPGVNIKRSPLCGRNFEYFSEDPYLSGRMAAAWTVGVESQGVGASLKHYAVNNQETRRMSIDALVDERALHEIYLSAFEYAVQNANPSTVMCAYNKVNGDFASESFLLLTEILRNRWGFRGLVVSDWGAVADRVAGLRAGLDLEMPGSSGQNDRKISRAVKKGDLDMETLDAAVLRILELIEKTSPSVPDTPLDLAQQHDLARTLASESVVLLKNKDQVLPLNKNKKIALIGRLATEMRYQGAGSSRVSPTKLPDMCNAFTEQNVHYTYSPGYRLTGNGADPGLVEEAVIAAKNSDVSVVFVGLTDDCESEAFDRQHLDLSSGQNELLDSLISLSRPLVVVLCGGSPVELPWLEGVDGLLNAYLPGQAGAEALTDILFGDVNPSGKLAETYPLSANDTTCATVFASEKYQAPYLESIFVGYRYYDAAQKEVCFPFGFGLSYTSFEYLNMKVDAAVLEGDQELNVRVSIRNTGPMCGQEILQLYIAKRDSRIFRAAKTLHGFQKVTLGVSQEQTVLFNLKRRDFAYYNTLTKDFEVEPGEYEILVGASSRDIRLRTVVWFRASDLPVPEEYTDLNSYMAIAQKDHSFTLEDFRVLYGRSWEDIGVAFPTINTPICDLRDHFIGRILFRMVMGEMKRRHAVEVTTQAMMVAALREMPLRSLAMMSEGRFTLRMAEGLIDLINGRICRGLFQVITSRVGL